MKFDSSFKSLLWGYSWSSWLWFSPRSAYSSVFLLHVFSIIIHRWINNLNNCSIVSISGWKYYSNNRLIYKLFSFDYGHILYVIYLRKHVAVLKYEYVTGFRSVLWWWTECIWIFEYLSDQACSSNMSDCTLEMFYVFFHSSLTF